MFLWRSRGKLWEFWTEASGGWGLGQEPWAVFWNCPLTPGTWAEVSALQHGAAHGPSHACCTRERRAVWRPRWRRGRRGPASPGPRRCGPGSRPGSRRRRPLHLHQPRQGPAPGDGHRGEGPGARAVTFPRDP
uniref:Rho guanine nucleotide exchange factor 10 n=1 Tax=Rousettus aegyptiacus TaxID=9407 RepID=A0A7J8DVU3_ROUAE|nr:Rho guanine nucleotide exchange factor 10 [Rousettus aegyptiacus]